MWNAESFLNGTFTNNLGSTCTLVAKEGTITGEYSTKPLRGTLVSKTFPIHGTYTAVKDGALLTFIVTFKMTGERKNGLENISVTTWNGKVYADKNTFKMNWLLVANESADSEWAATNLGQDTFTKQA